MKKLFGALITTFIIALFAGTAMADEKVVPQGVSVEGVEVSGLTEEQANQTLNEIVAGIQQKNLVLKTVADDEFEIPFSSIGLKIDAGFSGKDLVNVGRRGNVLKRFKETRDAAAFGKNFSLDFTYDESLLRKEIQEQINDLSAEPLDATVSFETGEAVITPGHNGIKVNLNATLERVASAFDAGWDRENLEVMMDAEVKEAEHKAEELQEYTTCLGTYTTTYVYSSANRKANIANGASFINAIEIKPGETFGFTEHVVPFTLDNGYATATGYSGGRTVDSIGGGICQVSSTLYNAVLRAELTIVERAPHQMIVDYVPLGGDATIAEGYIDFKFKNEYPDPVFIGAFCDGNSITVSIFGKETRPANRTIDFESVTEAVISPPADVVTVDNSLPAGYEQTTQSAHTGYVASFYKNVYVDGVQTERVLINNSSYGAYPRYVTVGGYSEGGGEIPEVPVGEDP